MSHRARCPRCGGAGVDGAHACDHARGEDRRPTDIASAIVACRARGWAVVEVPGEGLRPCAPGEPGAYADLGRYAFWLEHGDDALAGGEP